MVQLPSMESTAAFIILLAVVVATFIGAHVASGTGDRKRLTRSGLLFAAVWLTVFGLVPFARSVGMLTIQAQPFILAASFGSAAVFAFSPYGRRMALGLPLAMLVGIQVYRFPLELILHRWWQEGFLPIQMTYAGSNFDIITGIVALPVALLALRLKSIRWPFWLFNVMGMILLIRIVMIVNLSSDTPLRTLLGGYETGPEVDAFFFPYIWLPTVAAAGALFFHIITFRRLVLDRKRKTV